MGLLSTCGRSGAEVLTPGSHFKPFDKGSLYANPLNYTSLQACTALLTQITTCRMRIIKRITETSKHAQDHWVCGLHSEDYKEETTQQEIFIWFLKLWRKSGAESSLTFVHLYNVNFPKKRNFHIQPRTVLFFLTFGACAIWQRPLEIGMEESF